MARHVAWLESGRKRMCERRTALPSENRRHGENQQVRATGVLPSPGLIPLEHRPACLIPPWVFPDRRASLCASPRGLSSILLLVQEGVRGWSSGGRSEYAVTLSPSLVISDCWSPMVRSASDLKSDLSPSSVILSRFAPPRIALSGAKGLTVNSAKHPFHFAQGKLREGSLHFQVLLA